MTKSRIEKRGGAARRAGSMISRVLDPALRRQGFAEIEVVSRWQTIVGPVLAARCLPERIVFPRGDNTGGTLHIRADGAFALELQHFAPVVIDKINTFYGYRAVERLKITQGPLPEPRTPRRAEIRPLDAAGEAEVAEAVAATRDAGLRQSLAALGRNVIGEKTGRREE